ncbi:hypothetical protein ACSZMY_00250 [Aeromonas hydrophila]
MQFLDIFKNDRPQLKQYWVLMKVAPLERLLQMQKGLLYMNSLDYFSSLKGEDGLKVRSDEIESIYAQFHAGTLKNGHRIEMSLNIPDFGDFDIPRGTKISVGVPSSKNVFLYCMTCIADSNIVDDTYYMDRRMTKFGSHTLVINNSAEFFARYTKAINNNPDIYLHKHMDGGCGLIDYIRMSKHSGKIGLFIKDKAYSWQKEYRFVLGAKDEALNQNGALELNIGDISDITKIVKTKDFINSPGKVTKRPVYRETNGTYKFVE